MRKTRIEFSEEEDRFIIENQDLINNAKIASALKRSIGTIDCRKKLLYKRGLIKSLKIWTNWVTDQETQFVKDNVWELGAKECAKRLMRPYMTIYYLCKRMGLRSNPELEFKNRQNISHFTDCRDPFVAYFLGLMWADGNITKPPKHRIKLKIKSSDFSDIGEYVSRVGIFWNQHSYGDRRHKNWSEMTVFEVTHRDLWRFFESNDYLVKSGASADKILAHIPEHLRHYWWRGYFDGDGCFANRRICFNSGMEQDWTFVQNLGKYLGVDFSIERKDRGTRAGSKASLSRWHFIKKIVDYMYNGEQFGFSRKKSRCFDYLNTYLEPKKRGGNTSKYRGVCWSKHTKSYVMQISSGQNRISQRFDDEVSAAKAYDAIAQKLFGNKAILNFP